ncbi:MAG: hypothetical protein J6I40_01665 [Mailhella sp.]|nr:hypothetical protein [Mailhella sp.]
MQAFFQGTVDNFCAVYAVLNALQVLFGITVLQARKLFNRTLLAHSADALEFSRILSHGTDYVSLVDDMLADVQAHEFPELCVQAPFGPTAPCQQVWEVLRSCARPPLPLISVFRFLRFMPEQKKPYVDHWTVGHYMDMEGLHFLDCSLESGGLYCLPYSRLTDASHPLAREYVVIPPESVRILSSSSRVADLPV